MADKTDDFDKNALKIGDYVIFKDVARGLYLGVEGILLEDMVATEGISLQDSLFCIHLQRQYSASRDLQAFLANYDMDEKRIEDESAKKYLMALRRGLENEKKLNDTYMRKKYGQKVAFGDIIQLFHVKSGKYLTVVPDRLATSERENIHVTLDVNGSALSWLQIYPRFKIDKEGDRVLSNAEMYLKAAERTNEYIHSADRAPIVGHHREVNCALESTSWRLKIYQSSADSLDRSILLASQLAVITDPETRSNLTVGRKKLESLDDKAVLQKPNHILTSGESVLPTGAKGGESVAGGASVAGSYIADQDEHSESEAQDEQTYFHDFGDIILEPVTQSHLDSNHLWVIESNLLLIGGPIKWKTDQVRFKHLNTGQYLRLLTRFAAPTDGGELIEEMLFTTTRDPSLTDTLFYANELNSTGKLLSNAKALQIGQNGTWIERGEVLEDSVFTFMVKGSKDRGAALSLIISRCANSGPDVHNNCLDKDDSVESSSSSNNEPMDVFVGLAARDYLRKYHDMTVIPRSDSVTTVWPSAVRSDMDFFQLVIDKTVFFSQGFPISSANIQLGIDKADPVLRRRRQTLLREQNTLEVVLRMISKLVPVTEKLERMKSAPSAKRKKVHISDEEIAMINMGQALLRKCFQLLYYSILDNQENQMYVADFMPVLLAHLNAQPLAGKSVTEMLSKNLELQETKIGTREIQIFVAKLRSSKMNSMYLQLLQACCSCEGAGVDGNQCKVASMLFSDTNDIIINLHADYSRTSSVLWLQPSLYIPPAPVPGSPVRGHALITKGLPQLSLAWTTNSIDFSPLGLFGKLSVNVEELFRKSTFDTLDDGKAAAGGALKKKSKKKSTAEQKEAVASYFIAEMFLGAEMCMDRNYVAMHKLDPLFPYEVLVAILRLDVTSSLKSAAVRLLMCLHVDRDPQAASKIPLLTRTWSDIKKNTEPQLPYIDVGRRYTFGLIQQTISEHIRDMAGRRWDELSQHMLKMLRTLVQFNFYGTNDRIKDVIAPLIAALDRRKVTGPEYVESSRKSPRHRPGKAPTIAAADSALNGASKGDTADGTAVNLFENKDAAASSGIESKEDANIDTDYIDYSFDNEVQLRDGSADPGIHVQCARGCYRFVRYLTNFTNAAQVIGVLDDSDTKIEVFKNPLRYSKAPIYELETMVEAVDILAFAQRVIEDRNISLLLRYFYCWESGAEKRPPNELFEQVVDDAKQLSLDIADFDNVMIDVLMFVHTPLMQSTLEVLMAHHSMRRTLLDNASNVQLLASHRRERQYKMVDQMLQQLEQNAETHELWGELETDADHLLNQQTKDILKELTDICRVRRTVLEFDEDYYADSDIQDLFRNLGCFDICMKVLGLMDSVEENEDGNLDDVALNTRDLCLLCNTLLYWFFLGNAKNQELGFQELEFFIDTLDDEISSHLVIRSIFKSNESLMRLVQYSIMNDLVDKIFKEGKSHHYLALFASISHVGDKNIVENQFEIVKNLTSPGRLQKLSCFLVPVDSREYEEKRELMKPLLHDQKDVSLDDLPPLLAYHLMFLDVLSGCTVGRLNITTVEAKVQSVFNYIDLVNSILDDGTILYAKIIMTKFLFNAVIEVELVIPGLEKSYYIWKLLDSFQQVLETAKDEVVKAQTLGWESEEVSRQRIEFILVCIMTIGGYFTHYFDATSFRGSDAAKGGDKNTKFSKSTANQMIVSFFHRIKEIYDLESPILSESMKVMMRSALDALKKQGAKYIHTVIPPRGQSEFGKLMRGASTRSMQSNSSPEKPPSRSAAPSAEIEQSSFLKSPLSSPRGKVVPMKQSPAPAKISPEHSEQRLIGSYKEFLQLLNSNKAIQYKADNENVAFISILESLPFEADTVVSDVRYETLIRKLVSHIRENIKIVNNQKRLDARVTKTSTWIIRAFRTMIENRMGMSIYERDDEGGQEQDIACAPVVNALNSCGATALCLDLIADGIDEGLQLEAIKLGVGLLFKEGGALEVQGIMNNHLTKTNSELFFKQVRLTLQKLQAWHTWNETIILEEGQEPSPPDEVLIVRFLQLMCEGHYLPNQDIVREQPNNAVSFNLLDDFVNYLNCLSRIPCRTSSVAAIRLSATILEVIQGPCEGNQIHFALETELVEALNRLNRAKLVHDCVEEEEIELKKTSIDIFQGLLEGQGENSPVYERVLSVIHLDIIHMMSKKPTLYDSSQDDNKRGGVKAELSEDQVVLQTECVVLLQMLCNYRPSLYDELGISRNIEDIVGSGTAMIEVIWRGDIHRRFFHVPGICDFLAKASKDALVENVDRSSTENKLIDFLNRSYEKYREVKHQQLLTELGISGIFSRKNQNRATWITFGLAILINLIFLFEYSHRSGSPEISPLINTITNDINILQAVVSSFTLILWLVVRSPVNYMTFEAAGYSRMMTIFYTATDPLTMYYVIYLVISFLGVLLENYYCSLLLLDIIVKNSITRDVLNAVITPRQQLLMAMLLTAFVIYIYSFFLFFFYEDHVGDDGGKYCTTMWNCLKTTMSYGLQNGGGIGDFLSHSDGQRLMLDLSFFCVVIVILLNVVFGIIIDTFSSLRVEKMARQKDTVEVCFICGIDKQIFDRASDEPDGFKTHIKVDHNMWNYLYFIFMLWEQDKDDDDGLEQYVRRAIDINEITWFPMNKAMRLEQVANPSEVVRKDMKDSVKLTETHMLHKFDEFKGEVTVMFQQLLQTLRQENANDGNGPQQQSQMFAPRASQGGGDDSLEEHTAATEHSYLAEIALGHHISIGLSEIDGLEMTADELAMVSCRIVFDTGMFLFDNIAVEDGRVIFDGERQLPLFDNVQVRDHRVFQVQVLMGGVDQHTNTTQVLKFVAVLEMSVLDLVSPEENIVITKSFSRMEQQGSCTAKFAVHCIEAKSFGRSFEAPSRKNSMHRSLT